MPRYVYRCARCGPFERWRAAGQGGGAASCPACGAASVRIFSAPMLRSLDRHLRLSLEREEQSRDAPELTEARRGRALQAHRHIRPPWAAGG